MQINATMSNWLCYQQRQQKSLCNCPLH